MYQLFIKIVSTFFYLGYLPIIPGTFGSLAGLAIYVSIRGNTLAAVFLFFLFTVLGFMVSGRAEKVFNKKDASCIVIDEVAGMFLSLLFLPHSFIIMICAFVLFRILDIIKPYPANKLQKLSGSLGVMIDDLVVGFYANLILQLIFRILLK